MIEECDNSGPVDPASDVVTDRLVLRCWTGAEVEAVLTARRFPDWADDFPAEGDRVVAGLIPQLDPVARHGHRVVVERATGLIAGSLGWFWPPSDGALEIGYGIVPSRRGRGYAPEAVRGLTEFAFTATEVDAVIAKVEPSNPASVRVLEKSGFGHRIELPGENLWQLGVTRAER
ncbi:GNAT family N-acetyltransferase [Nocardia spumae]|uniref:GNAT family N-acetyltransferase n=1 Tax=Nocardia spumae TaxID=2887190 RepID=UPI001D14EF34|nr:GNAT family N-acetyltransferase [Nocardia spumae]